VSRSAAGEMVAPAGWETVRFIRDSVWGLVLSPLRDVLSSFLRRIAGDQED